MTGKLAALFLAIVLIFTQSSCSADNGETGFVTSEYEEVNVFEGVTLFVKEGSITPAGLTLVFENAMEAEHIYGSFYCVERKDGDQWFALPYVIKQNVGWDEMARILPAKGSSEETIDWEWLYGSLNQGEYRIVKELLVMQEAGDYKKYYLAAEFVIA